MLKKILDSIFAANRWTRYRPKGSDEPYEIAVKYTSYVRTIFTLFINQQQVIEMKWGLFNLTLMESEGEFQGKKIKMIGHYQLLIQAFLIEVYFDEEKAGEFSFGRIQAPSRK
jgi:hypothetical protein